MAVGSRNLKSMPIDIVGSTTFGRYPLISSSMTANMIISDDYLVPFAGYLKRSSQFGNTGRGIYTSTILNKMVAVFDNKVYLIDKNLFAQKVGEIETYEGDVFIAENVTKQVGICDKKDIWIYNYGDNTFQKSNASTTSETPFLPGYLDYQNSRFMSVDLNTNSWRLSSEGDGLLWPVTPQQPYAEPFQTAADNPVAVVRVHGQGGMAMVMGSKVGEIWFDTGQQLFPYVKNTYFNLDYGCLNPATIATNETIVVWLGKNEKSSPSIMVSDGNQPKQITNDGINFKLNSLTNPTDSYAFLVRQDGHLLYIMVFPTDNLSYAYDFNTEKFFTLTDTNGDHYPARRAVQFQNTAYFISVDDGYLYEMSSNIGSYDSDTIPRVRICSTVRMPNNDPYVVKNVQIVTEMGMADSADATPKYIDMCFSKDGGTTFGNFFRKQVQLAGNQPNICAFWPRVWCNQFTPQFRFYGLGRYVTGAGTLGAMQ